jgi:hypothetical protein
MKREAAVNDISGLNAACLPLGEAKAINSARGGRHTCAVQRREEALLPAVMAGDRTRSLWTPYKQQRWGLCHLSGQEAATLAARRVPEPRMRPRRQGSLVPHSMQAGAAVSAAAGGTGAA